MRKLYFLLCFVAFSLLCFAEDSEKRVALVIGNQDYSGTGYNNLCNPVNDAKGMEEALKQIGFTISGGKALINANQDQMLAAIRQFRYDSRGANIAIFYYSGHGVTYGQDNLMLPVGKKIDDFYAERCVSLNTVRNKMKDSGSLLNIIILDACRSALRNGGKGGESMNNGLLRTEIPEGFLYCYATSENEEALDRPNGTYSYFTEALIKQMKDPNKTFIDMYREVRTQVVQATNNRQRPTINNGDLISGTLNFYLSPQHDFVQTPVDDLKLSPVGDMKLTYEDLSRKHVYSQPDSAISGRISNFYTQLSVTPNSTFTDTVWFKQVKPDGKVETCNNCEIMKTGYSYGKVYSFVKGESQFLSFSFERGDGSWDPGMYSFELWSGEKKLASKSITVKPAPTPGRMNTNIRVDKTTLEANRNNPKIREVVFESGTLKFVPRNYKGEFIIGNDITAIGDSAFKGCSGLTSVTIPNSVTSIGGAAFKGCTGLTSVTIPNSVTSIGVSAFYWCSGLTSVTIPNSVMSIGDWAFSLCSGLTRVTIPNSVMSIGDGAFWGCSGLTNVTIPNSVTSIGWYAFDGCSSISKPVYNNSIFVFLPRTYKGTYSIPDGIKKIADHAFAGCIELTDIIIPNSVTDVGDYAFDNCKNILRPLYNDSVFFYLPKDYKGTYELLSGIKRIASTAFDSCTNLIGIVIPNSVTSIGDWSFFDCSSLTSVTIPNSVTSIGGRAFSNCFGLTSVTIPNSVKSIGRYAFFGCSGLTSVTIKNAKIKIEDSSFSECPSLRRIYVPKGAKESIQKQLPEGQRRLVKER